MCGDCQWHEKHISQKSTSRISSFKLLGDNPQDRIRVGEKGPTSITEWDALRAQSTLRMTGATS